MNRDRLAEGRKKERWRETEIKRGNRQWDKEKIWERKIFLLHPSLYNVTSIYTYSSCMSVRSVTDLTHASAVAPLYIHTGVSHCFNEYAWCKYQSKCSISVQSNEWKVFWALRVYFSLLIFFLNVDLKFILNIFISSNKGPNTCTKILLN